MATPTIIPWPEVIGPQSVQFDMSDAVATSVSPFSGQTQVQQWPGAEAWTGTVTMPPLTQDQADELLAFLALCRGMANAFYLGDPLKKHPRGSASGVPIVDGANLSTSQTLNTRGWTPNAFALLLPGDYLQVGTRLYRCLGRINSDASGKATIPIWPSLREAPNDGDPLILNHPKGLFRLANNKRTWSVDETRLTRLSFQVQEYR